MVTSKWCQQTIRELSEGKISRKDLYEGPGAGRWSNDISRWAAECGDRNLLKLKALERKGSKARIAREKEADAKYKATMEALDSKKYLTSRELAEREALRKGGSSALQVIKKVCQTAVEGLEEARKEREK